MGTTVNDSREYGDTLLDENYVGYNEDLFSTVVAVHVVSGHSPYVTITQENRGRDGDDDYIALDLEQFLRVADRLREH